MPRTKKITIELSGEEVDAVEDRLFCNLSPEAWEKTRKPVHRFWRKLASAFDNPEERENGQPTLKPIKHIEHKDAIITIYESSNGDVVLGGFGWHERFDWEKINWPDSPEESAKQ